MSTLSAWAFGSVACSAAAKADQGGTLDSFSQSSARVGSTLGQQDGRAAGDASASAAPTPTWHFATKKGNPTVLLFFLAARRRSRSTPGEVPTRTAAPMISDFVF